ncbi:hypothetical protein BA895_04775 [Humibacillus sp. DSM 29435]|uniref:pyridoxamine 5'-phosphate oxidase family protein n=1 Tax=Humibacillus sp. DSM 29435 TaxID=1869167 RepID=UPI0008722C9C|nr:pyridoxamine 5'-phosphate oxidase family protein [Humibacillus sp. DSM 29435]OFE15834.1 hypothetical protein BA895_04775 [Humibacillus sp. DSM 29435]
MSGAYGDVAFTRDVRAAQTHYGRSAALARLGMGERFASAVDEPEQALSSLEAAFIRDRDGFYLATVSSTGWPYVQFRGGPPGFVQVTDEHTLRWADFRGNCQLVSTGNLSGSNKVSLFFMDYPRQARLKVYGHAVVLDAREARDQVEEVAVPGYRGIVERVVTVRVVAYDWNCPSHITPRYTIPELQGVLGPRGNSNTHNPTEGEDHEKQETRR